MEHAPTDGPPDLYTTLGFAREELSAVMRQVWGELIEFVNTPKFRGVVTELMSLPRAERPGFVARVLLQREELARRGVEIPDGILIQTSSFGDRRPTLFVVKKFLPSKYHGAWENLNITFDNEYPDEQVPRDPESAWRRPLNVALQNAALAGDLDLESLPPV
jgi:hypothetical protein